MTIEENIFKRAEVDFTKLKKYGFSVSGDAMVYEKSFMNGDFIAVIKIDRSGKIRGEVYDEVSGDVYLPLRVEEMTAGYVGEVRAAYIEILQNIREKCCRENYFVGVQANRIAADIKQKYGDDPDFPWGKYDDYGVFRNPDNAKWYALIMTIDKSKIIPTDTGKIEVLNIKLNEDKIPLLIKQKGFYPAYHMNKKYWITISLDDTLQDDVIMQYLEESHEFTQRKTNKQRNHNS
ncbi:MAG: MmcQ/YjbR family DNA-binding protein [Alphaproteobacteria bacterium]|nr:MmcQ/YjbR family DNA-binding protein [Alphaproteobacteria bacterium]